MSTRKPFDINFLAAQLQAARQPMGGFEAFRSQEVVTVLLSAFNWRDEAPKAERQLVIWNGVRSVPQTQLLTGPILERSIEAAERAWLRIRPQPGILIVGLSVPLPGATAKHLRGENITLSRHLPEIFRKARSNADLKIPPADIEPKGYTVTRVKVVGRSVHDRYEKAMDTIDLMRAKWNFAINRRLLIRFESGVSQPINRFRLSRVQTLHNPDGSSQFEGHWHDPTFSVADRPGVTASEWDIMEAARRRIGRRLLNHPYRAWLERALIRYTRALDTVDYESAFLKVWSLLELLTVSGGNNYDVTIRRVQLLFQDREITKQVLEHLRQQRNVTVHEENSGEHLRGLAWQVKHYVEQLVFLHLSLGRRFRSFDEAGQFLDQPTTSEALKRRIWLCRRAITMLN